MDKQDELAGVVRKAIVACGAAREADLAGPIAAAVRAYLGSDEVIERAARSMPRDVSYHVRKDCARAALSAAGGGNDAIAAIGGDRG